MRNKIDTVLKVGEIGLDTNTNMLKIGDGATAWDSLPYYMSTEEFKDEDGLRNKLKDMLLFKYFNMLREELGRTVAPSDLTGPEPQGWRIWIAEHKITYSKPASGQYMKLDLMGRPIYMPKEFANKALVLGLVP